MKKAGISALLALLFFCFVTLCAADETTSKPKKAMRVVPAEKLEKPGRKFAFLVAVSDYGRNATPLACTVNDVEAIRGQLLKIGFKDSDITVLKSGPDFASLPTKNNIEEMFASMLTRVKKGDWVIVYLSGHGVEIKGKKGSFFCPPDVRIDDLENSTVSIDAMMEQLSESPALFRWMIVDACRNDPNNPSRALFAGRASQAKSLTAVSDPPANVVLLQSCQPGEYSYEGGLGKAKDLKNGFFTLSLLEALSSTRADANKDGNVKFLELMNYVAERTNELAYVNYGYSQKPNFTGGNITDFVFLRDDKVAKAKTLAKEAEKLIDKEQFAEAKAKIDEAIRLDPTNKSHKRLAKLIEHALKPTQLPAAPAPASTGTTLPASSRKAGERKVFTVDGIEYAFRWCPPGEFMMGGNKFDSEKPVHKVKLTRGFWLLETEVTQSMWESVMGVNQGFYIGAKNPVEWVSWDDCQSFCRKLSQKLGQQVKLPTEAQWEYACRAGTTTAYCWGDDEGLLYQYGNYCDKSNTGD